MIAIEMRFLAGRYHATPWGRQVNEGAVEWPPSPWRLLRSLLATWYYKHSEVPEEQILELLRKLSAAPGYRLPATGEGHTRHFMPAANDAKTKIFDTFATVSRHDPLVVCWASVELTPGERSLLERLMESMSYLGRAESWIEAKVIDSYDQPLDATPLDETGVSDSQQLVRLLAVEDSESYRSWRGETATTLRKRRLQEKQERAAARGKPIEKEKLTPKELAEIEASLPSDLLQALQVDTNELRKAGWNRPPASRWMNYACTVKHPVATRSSRSLPRQLPTIARFAVASAVRPRLTEAILIGERLRRYLMGISGKQNEGRCSPIFSGKQDDGEPQGPGSASHAHAHYLAEASGPNNRGRISHLTVFAPQGLSGNEIASLRILSQMHGVDGHDLKLVLVGIGNAEDFGGWNERDGQSSSLATSALWQSRTPFVPTDHLRIRRSDLRDPQKHAAAITRELTRLIRRELSRRPWLAEHAETVEVSGSSHTFLSGVKTPWYKFRRRRVQGGGNCSSSSGYGFVLRFTQPITGPICLGYGSHFGLGQFEAVS